MSTRDMTLFGRSVICLFWIVLGGTFILRGPRYVAPVAAYAGGFICVLLAVFLVLAAVRQRRAKCTPGWTRKA